MKRVVIMADGKGMRWNNYMGIPKHFAAVNGEKLISRSVRLLAKASKEFEIIVTSHDKRYEISGSRRYEPLNNIYEIDRFTEELIVSDMCFLYGDTFYTESSIKKIIEEEAEDILFFGNQKTIVAVKIKDEMLFRTHVKQVKDLYLQGKLRKCAGWQVYQSFTGQSFENPIEIKEKFILVDDMTTDINSPCDYETIKI